MDTLHLRRYVVSVHGQACRLKAYWVSITSYLCCTAARATRYAAIRPGWTEHKQEVLLTILSPLICKHVQSLDEVIMLLS